MNRIDIKQRKKFKIGDFFDAKRGKSIQLQKINEGTVPVIAAAGYNQGIAGYYDVVAEYENKITVSCNGVGCGSTFYHNYPFTINGDAIVLLEKIKISDYSKKFITSVLHELLSNKYSYEEKCSGDKAMQEFVSLPVDKFGNPDRIYMENYIKDLEEKCKTKLQNLILARGGEISKINSDTWKEFRVGSLFHIHPTKAYKLTNANLLDGGEYPVVVNSAFNNGIGGYTTNQPTEKGNMITFSDTVDANTIFYQEKDFVGYAHVQGLYPYGEFNDKWNKLTLLFFCSCFRKSAFTYGFDYGNKFRRDIAIDLNVLLPVDNEGNPNWEYMENYMKNLMKKNKEKLECLK